MAHTNVTGWWWCGIDAVTLRSLLLLSVAGTVAACVTIPDLAMPAVGLAVNSDPPGASAFLNGRLVGATPLEINRLKIGHYSIRFEKEGFVPLQRNVGLDRNGLSLRETLQPLATAELTVEIKPDGAEVLLDGEVKGHTPLHVFGLPLGPHDLLVRKTNYDNYATHVEVIAGEPLVFNNFSLNDKILAMLNGNIARESWRVMHYMDLGHYYFVNDRLNEAADLYKKAIRVSAESLDLSKETSAEERHLQERLRSEDRSRLNKQIVYKEQWPGKDVKAFTESVELQRNIINDLHIKEIGWILEESDNYYNNGQLDESERILLKYIDVTKNPKLLEQPFLSLLKVRIKKNKLGLVQETVTSILSNYADRPDLLRKAGDALYIARATFSTEERPEVLSMTEKLFHTGIKSAQVLKNPELQAQCSFQLAITVEENGRPDQSIPLYKESIAGTTDDTAKEEYAQRLSECYKIMKNFDEARKLLIELAKSPRKSIASKAKQELSEIASLVEKK